MDARTPISRRSPNPHADCETPQACTVLSIGTPTLIAAALRAGRRGADPNQLVALRATLAALAHGDPAAMLVAVWIDAKLGLAVLTEADLALPSLPKEGGEIAGDPGCMQGALANEQVFLALIEEVRS